MLAAAEPLMDAGLHAGITADLGEVRGFDYYTGMRMRVWAPGSAAPIARGGRYDHMLARYGADLPATGLAIDLDALEEVLIAAEVELGEERPTPGMLVALADRPVSAELRAIAVEQVLRGPSWRPASVDRGAAHASRAHRRWPSARGADRLTWLHAEGSGPIAAERWPLDRSRMAARRERGRR